MGMTKTSRARGFNRGGTGGGYEAIDPDYQSNRLRQLRATHDLLDTQYRKVFLAGLSRWEQKFVKDRRMEVPQLNKDRPKQSRSNLLFLSVEMSKLALREIARLPGRGAGKARTRAKETLVSIDRQRRLRQDHISVDYAAEY